MQTIHPTQENIHSLFNGFEYMYANTSEKKYKKNTLLPVAVCEVFKPLVFLFNEYGHTDYHPKYTEYHPNKLSLPKYKKKNIIVCVSGGKDSLATALYYKELGYNIYLYHLKGINKTYKDEAWAAIKLAEMLDLPLKIESIELQGNHDWVEHPMKNMILANMALQYGIREGVTTKIAFGNFSTSTLQEDPFDVCGGDCMEMWKVYEEIINTIIPGFELYRPLINFQSTMDILFKNPVFIPYTQSCIGPYRYREYLKGRNEQKYGISLFDKRCGSCWKCCLEYIMFCDHDIYPYNEEYYKKCLKILQKTLKTENGIKASLEETWDHYVFYDKMRSKYYGKCRSSIRSIKTKSG